MRTGNDAERRDQAARGGGGGVTPDVHTGKKEERVDMNASPKIFASEIKIMVYM